MITITDKRESCFLILACWGLPVVQDKFTTTATVISTVEPRAYIYTATPSDIVTVSTGIGDSATLFVYVNGDAIWSGKVIGENEITIPVPSSAGAVRIVLDFTQ